jgi:hypothetical protein
LVGANALLAFIAVVSVVQVARARSAAVLPKIVVVAVFPGENRVRLAVRNVGIGPALEVHAKVELPKNETTGVVRGAIAPGSGFIVRPQALDALWDEVANAVPTARISGTCKNSFGKTIGIDYTLDLAGEIRAAMAASMEPEEDALRELTRTVAAVKRAIESLSK